MDFSTMRSKVDAHEYKSFKELETDFWRIVNNSRTYNANGSRYYNLAVKLGEKVRESRLDSCAETEICPHPQLSPHCSSPSATLPTKVCPIPPIAPEFHPFPTHPHKKFLQLLLVLV